ncbi:hypothetical protein GDO78_022370 [Eleutherodactylus coqui]|uniref:Uncharacterized protein n=1 Tax=Eleutherodactylus coqui TaxID=57060 RepID=A0A8J6EGL7_ELECQ|nr:hypothetical protein GDO78_022370 [Eleutherodactylus coqui]
MCASYTKFLSISHTFHSITRARDWRQTSREKPKRSTQPSTVRREYKTRNPIGRRRHGRFGWSQTGFDSSLDSYNESTTRGVDFLERPPSGRQNPKSSPAKGIIGH